MMANEFRTLDSHSAEYFGDTRSYWWNSDFLELMGKRLSLDRVRDVLDVGCGVGHWGQLLANVLPSNARVQGVDRDPLWVEKAAARATAHGLADRFSYRVSVAEKLPFADASFDLVTCQTVLIHTPDPGAAVDEMVRVARPGGLILAAEPNNIASALTFDSHVFLPPYDRPEQRAELEERTDRKHRDFWIWSREDTHRYFLAGGGRDVEFDALWTVAIGGRDKFDKAIADRTYADAGGCIGYLVAGRKP
jgi:SAM-dependent methyltransferase